MTTTFPTSTGQPATSSSPPGPPGTRTERRRPRPRWSLSRLRRWVSPLATLMIWPACSSSGVLQERTLASPAQIAVRTVELIQDGSFGPATLASVQRVVIGFAIGSVTALTRAVLAGFSRIGEDVIDPPMQMLRALEALLAVLGVQQGERDVAALRPGVAVHPLDGHRGAAQDRPDRARRHLPALPQQPGRHPQRRPQYPRGRAVHVPHLAPEGRTLRFGLRVHTLSRDTSEQAWAHAQWLLDGLDPRVAATAQQALQASESTGQARMTALRDGRTSYADARELEVTPNLWSGVGLVRGGAGTALVGSHEEVADRLEQYHDFGIDEFVLSGYPHVEEAWSFAGA